MIAYAKHPLSDGDKAKLRADGYKILDIRFKPAKLSGDDIVFPKPRHKKKVVE